MSTVVNNTAYLSAKRETGCIRFSRPQNVSLIRGDSEKYLVTYQKSKIRKAEQTFILMNVTNGKDRHMLRSSCKTTLGIEQ